MSEITIVFTKKPWNIISWLIRYTLPRSRFALATSSHCVIYDEENDKMYEASMLKGVHESAPYIALAKSKIVKTVKYKVPDAKAGLEFAKAQVGKKYDYKGALGLGIAPGRDWAEDDVWFCYELAAATLKAAGLDIFKNVSHINESALFCIKT